MLARARRPVGLTEAVLPTFDDRVRVPRYDRTRLRPAIVHIGVGGFHRAHQAVYLDELAGRGHEGWGEIGVGLRTTTMRDALAPQDCLWTVLERSADEDRARIVGAMTRYLFAPDDPAAVIDALADPQTRVVTLTITGDGYLLDGSGSLDASHPDVQRDLAHPEQPQTFAGYLVAALDRRRRAGLPPFTVLSCDNMPRNGPATRASVVGFATLRDPGLGAWIDEHGAFPSSMVDRITPGPCDDARSWVAEELGVHDRSPVVAEPFTQWIVEDAFCAGRPPLEEVGVRFVDDVEPYKLVKTRLLNAAHSAMGYIGYLAGCRTTAEVMANPALADYLHGLMVHDIAPSLPRVAGMDLEEYVPVLLRRFANPRIADELQRLCGRGSTKMPAYLLPSLADARREDRPAAMLALAVAAWLRYLTGEDLEGRRIDVKDARLDDLRALIDADAAGPQKVLGERSIFGALADDPELVDLVTEAMEDLESLGAVATACERLAADALHESPPQVDAAAEIVATVEAVAAAEVVAAAEAVAAAGAATTLEPVAAATKPGPERAPTAGPAGAGDSLRAA